MIKKVMFLLIMVLLLSFGAGYMIHTLIRQEAPTDTSIDSTNPEDTEAETPIEGDNAKKIEQPYGFDGQKAYDIAKILCQEIGIRVEGSQQEKSAAARMENILTSCGCDSVSVQSFPLPNGSTSQNVIAVVGGQNPSFTFLIGGHYDSRSTTTGGNDNASGAATTVELARVFAHNRTSYPTLIFILFGSEEDFGEITSEHTNSHYGSRYYVNTLSQKDKSSLIGMISLDMVGSGSVLFARYMGIGPMQLIYMMQDFGSQSGYQLYLKQSGNLSDHDPFEKAGVPSLWFEYLLNPNGDYDNKVHRPADNLYNIVPSNLTYTGTLMQKFIENLSQQKCEQLESAKRN